MKRIQRYLPALVAGLTLLYLPACGDSSGAGGGGFVDFPPAGTFYFAAFEPTTGTELWKTDGTRAGTALVKDINPAASPYAGTAAAAPLAVTDDYSSRPGEFTIVGSVVYFVADDGNHGRELWKSDGTEAGTVLVKDIYPGEHPDTGVPFSSSPDNLTGMGGLIYFSAYEDLHGEELWVSDGTEEGTILLKDINPGTEGSWPDQIAVMGSRLFMTAYHPTSGEEPWISDGTEAGTVLLKDLDGTGYSTWPAHYFAVGGAQVFFFAADANGYELWRTDGTEAGTRLVKDICPGSYGSYPSNFADFNGTLYFTANDCTNGTELWASDGTPDGAWMVADINNTAPGANSSPSDLSVLGATLLFRADDGEHGSELWRTDGIATELVRDIFPGTDTAGVPYRSTPRNLTAVGDSVLFGAADATHGVELWITDGTTAETRLVKDIYPVMEPDGPGSSGLTAFRAGGGVLYFIASDRVHGFELWRSDGTAARTGMIKDINPGAASAFP